ncbi:MAG: hypothetical protein JW817_00830 [Clostridiales bacterium]|nr:hypothetical protein [Clostridiales bacterium]
MGLFNRRKEKEIVNLDKNPSSSNDKSIEAYDEFGRKILISRKDWVQSVLLGLLEKDWNDPNALYQDIVQAVIDEFIEEIIAAAEHLKMIDPTAERSHALLAIVYMKTNNLYNAEKILNEYIEKHGKTGTILTNLAKVYAAQGKKESSVDTLWEGLQIDPNQENGLGWWLSIQIEENGQKNYGESLKMACQIENSWLPQLYLAGYYLEQKELDEAVLLYKQILPSSGNNPNLLYVMSGDLGRNGFLQECIDLTSPVYNCQKHDIRAGLNLLQAYLETENYIDGQKLLGEIMQLKRPDLKDRLMKMSDEFEKIKASHTDYKETTTDTPKFQIMKIDKPIWFYGLQEPDWLIPERIRSTKVGILAYADISSADIDVYTVRREDDAGRMTRSIPLFLVETLLYYSDHEPVAMIPVAKGSGPAVSKTEVTDDGLKEIAAKNSLDYVISGSILLDDTGCKIRNRIYCSAEQKISSVNMETNIEGFGLNCLQMLSDIHLKLGSSILKETASLKAIYQLPQVGQILVYLSALGQLFTQTLVANDIGTREALWGERNMLNWYINLALADPHNPIPRIMLISGMAKSKAYGSEVYKEFKDQAIHLLSEKKESDVSRKLLPFVYNMFDMQEEYSAGNTYELA